MMTVFNMLHRMLNLGETIGCEKDAGKRVNLRTDAALEISKWSATFQAPPIDLHAVREVIARLEAMPASDEDCRNANKLKRSIGDAP